jgi:hypothetical protein
MNRDKIYFGKLVDSILKDIRKEKQKFFKLEKHLTDVNETIPDKYQINELIQIRNCLKRAVKDILDHDEEYICSGIPIIAEIIEDPELFMYYTKEDFSFIY